MARNGHSAAMVNDRFPKPSRYGFEIVHARHAASKSLESAINRKFTANPIGRIFR
jgi:hypothetical protein